MVRTDSAGGSLDQVEWTLERGYHILTKEHSAIRAEHFSHGVKQWFADHRHPGRELGWLEVERNEYSRPVKRLVIRFPELRTQKMHYACLITTLEPADVVALLGCSEKIIENRRKMALAYAYLYDQRAGTIEIEIKESKQGLGIIKRQKKKFEAQRMVTLLNQLAHNILVWARRLLSKVIPETKLKFARYGALRLTRDIFHTAGKLEFGEDRTLNTIVLNKGAPFVKDLAVALGQLLSASGVKIAIAEI